LLIRLPAACLVGMLGGALRQKRRALRALHTCRAGLNEKEMTSVPPPDPNPQRSWVHPA